MIRALVADDHAVVRHGLRDLFSESGDIVVQGEATTAQEVLDQLQKESWDVIVLDLNLPDRNGLDLLGDVRRQRPDLPVLILTMFAEEQFAVRAMRAGAAGYVTKESAPQELIQAVRKVVNRGRYVSPELAERLAHWVDGNSEKPPHETLSTREFQIFLMLASGHPVSKIADELCLSVKTVSTYRARVLEKMHLKANADLTLYAVRNRLVQ
jgi:two-component system invasion response regulator UvrY